MAMVQWRPEINALTTPQSYFRSHYSGRLVNLLSVKMGA